MLFLIPDKNECEEWGYCDQLCKNTQGGHECSCASGYVRSGAGADAFCRASPSKPKMQLLFTHYNSIMVADPYGSEARWIPFEFWRAFSMNSVSLL